MKRPLYIYPLILLTVFCSSPQAIFQEYKTLETDYTVIHYSNDAQLSDFLWKIGYLKLNPTIDSSVVENRVDRIVERVEAILDMYPENFGIDIFLHSGYTEGNIAYYSERTKSITIFVERATDGVLAHEIAHAVINAYFQSILPPKLEEMLCQYVDSHLWQDYY